MPNYRTSNRWKLQEKQLVGNWKLIKFIESRGEPSGSRTNKKNPTLKIQCLKKHPVWSIQCLNCGWAEDRIIDKMSRFKNRCQHCHGKPQGESGFNSLWDRYQRYHRNDLTKEQFKKLVSSNCFYCDSPPMNQSGSHKSRYHSWGLYVSNGIDRKDNSKHYIIENCVSCCHWCNRAKSGYSYEEYLTWAKQVFSKWKT